jgi:Transglycosylase SLT domain
LLVSTVATGLAVTAGVAMAAEPASAMVHVPLAVGGSSAAARASATLLDSQMPRELIVPDLIAVLPSGITAEQLTRIRALAGVRAVQTVSGAGITINGKAATVLGATAAELREWTPPGTASDDALWERFAAGDLITTTSSAKSLGLRTGNAYRVAAAVTTEVTAGPSASSLGLPGIAAVVTATRAAQLGLIPDVGVLINAPGANLITLVTAVRQVLGSRGQVVRLVPVTVSDSDLPVDSTVSTTAVPDSYVQLYQESAALYCRGLSWTVLAAIGEIESGNGTNDGPSSAGALGPMQFMPGTWAEWGIDAFGQTGTPNIENPLDAVPSAARMLCADGAGEGGASLSAAIYDYNHATWYVTEVLDLAAEYAREY